MASGNPVTSRPCPSSHGLTPLTSSRPSRVRSRSRRSPELPWAIGGTRPRPCFCPSPLTPSHRGLSLTEQVRVEVEIKHGAPHPPQARQVLHILDAWPLNLIKLSLAGNHHPRLTAEETQVQSGQKLAHGHGMGRGSKPRLTAHSPGSPCPSYPSCPHGGSSGSQDLSHRCPCGDVPGPSCHTRL